MNGIYTWGFLGQLYPPRSSYPGGHLDFRKRRHHVEQLIGTPMTPCRYLTIFASHVWSQTPVTRTSIDLGLRRMASMCSCSTAGCVAATSSAIGAIAWASGRRGSHMRSDYRCDRRTFSRIGDDRRSCHQKLGTRAPRSLSRVTAQNSNLLVSLKEYRLVRLCR